MYIDGIMNELKAKIENPRVLAYLTDDRSALIISCTTVPITMARIPLKAFSISQCQIDTAGVDLTNDEYRAIDKAIKQILKTPATKLLAKPKYFVMPDYLMSSRGPQFLSTDGRGRVFFAAKINGLKQTFALDELQDIINQTDDGTGVSWLTSVINQYKKLVD